MSSTAADSANPPKSSARIQGGVVPYLQVDGANAAGEFYKKAFGAVEVGRQPADEKGRTIHIHLHIGGSSVMLSDAFPEHGHPHQPAQGYSLMMPVKNIDAQFDRAVKAGATSVMPPADMFWGDRYGQLKDPFGVLWAMIQVE